MNLRLLFLLLSFFFFLSPTKAYSQAGDRVIDREMVAILKHFEKSGNDSIYFDMLEKFNKSLISYKEEHGTTEKYLLGRGFFAKGIVDKDYEKAIQIFNKSIEKCLENEYKRVEALISNDLANIYLNNGETKKALEIFLKNAKTFKEVKDWGAYGWLLIDIGNIYFSDEYYEHALENYTKAMEVFKGHYKNDKLEGALAVCYQNLGMVFENKANLDTAYYFYSKSLQSRKRAKQYGNYSVAYSHLANYFLRVNQLDSSEYYIRKAIDSDLKSGPNSNLINSYSMYIQFLQRNKRYEEAKTIALKSYKIAKSRSNETDVIFTTSNLGISYYYLGNLDSALFYFDSSANRAKALNKFIDYSNGIENIISVLKKMGKAELTPPYYEKLLKIKDELFKNNATKLQLNSEIEKRRLEKQKFEIEKTRQKTVTIFLAIIIALILIILAIIIRAEIKRKKQNIQLKKTLSDLQETSEHLNKTYSIIAHDLRGPLGSVLGIIELLLDGSVEKNEWPKYLNLSYKTLNQTNSLMLNLLKWSRAKGGKLSFEPMKMDIVEAVENTLSLHRHAITQKSIELKMNLGDKSIAYADKNMVMTILRNLLNNAIKFTAEGGNINISIEEQKENIVIKIKDSGVGMTPQQINDALDANSFETRLGTNNEKGSGLGLKLVIDLLEINKGRLEINSQVGKGSEFTIYLPKAL